MKKYLFMIVAALLSLPIAAQKQQKNNITIHGTAVKKQPNNLYIVDGIKVSKEFWDSIPKEKIKSSNTFENIEQLFIIETKTGASSIDKRIKQSHNPLISINIDSITRSKLSPEEYKMLSIQRNIGAMERQIAAVSRQLVELKRQLRPETYVGSITTIKGNAAQALKVVAPSFRVMQEAHSKTPLFIVEHTEGKLKVASEKEIHNMDTNLIEAVTIFKDSQAKPFKEYGDISNGVILIKVKNK